MYIRRNLGFTLKQAMKQFPAVFVTGPFSMRRFITWNMNVDFPALRTPIYTKLPVKFEHKGCRKWFRCKELSLFERRRNSATLSIKHVKTTKQMGRLL